MELMIGLKKQFLINENPLTNISNFYLIANKTNF